MIGFFPEPYEDELFFSICSRYHVQAAYFSTRRTSQELFGQRRVRPAPDVPGHIGALIERLPKGHRHSVQRIIDDHTLLPVYGPFLSQQRLLRTRKEMAQNSPRPISLHGALGINTTKFKWRALRYCPGCVEVDRELHGETYWHRLHQVPGVEVCPIHRAHLRNSAAPLRHSLGREVFVTAEQALAETTDSCDDANPILPAQLQIAEDVAWLLAHPQLEGYTLGHRQRYIGLLFERGLATYRGKLNTQNLTEQVVAYYSPEFLTALDCAPRDFSHRGWISELVSGSQHVHPPIHHLLILQFLGVPLKEFFELPESRLPFGKPPWPCLNRGSEHYGENNIWKYQLSFTQRNGRRPRGTFHCSCGFIYSRVGPDESESDRFIIDRYVQYGKTFKEKVKALLAEGCPKREIAKRLGVSLGTLEHLVWNMRSRAEPVDDRRGRKRRTYDENEKLRASNRKALLDALEKWPNAGRHEIHRRLGAAYYWLYCYDQPWLSTYLPKYKRSQGPPDRIDWNRKDLELIAAVRTEADRVRALQGRPVRVSSTIIARKLRIIEIVSKRPQKIPLTIQVLREVAESLDDYVIRRILWTEICYREEGISPGAWQVGARAGLRWDQCKTPKFKTVIDQVVTNLNDQLCLRYA